jgi:hypothetical protein
MWQSYERCKLDAGRRRKAREAGVIMWPMASQPWENEAAQDSASPARGDIRLERFTRCRPCRG